MWRHKWRHIRVATAHCAVATPYTSEQFSIPELMCFAENKLLILDGIRLTKPNTLLPVCRACSTW